MMKPLQILLSTTCLLGACGNNSPGDNNAPNNMDMSSCWWCTDATQDLPTTDMSTDMKQEGKNNTSITYWFGQLDTTNGQGTFDYEVYDDQNAGCKVSYPVTQWMNITSCDACAVAGSFVLGEPIIDDNSCEQQRDQAGSMYTLGHSSEMREKGNLLLEKQGEQWVGYGSSKLDGKMWTFYYYELSKK